MMFVREALGTPRGNLLLDTGLGNHGIKQCTFSVLCLPTGFILSWNNQAWRPGSNDPACSDFHLWAAAVTVRYELLSCGRSPFPTPTALSAQSLPRDEAHHSSWLDEAAFPLEWLCNAILGQKATNQILSLSQTLKQSVYKWTLRFIKKEGKTRCFLLWELIMCSCIHREYK